MKDKTKDYLILLIIMAAKTAPCTLHMQYHKLLYLKTEEREKRNFQLPPQEDENSKAREIASI